MYKACIFDLDGTLTDTLESLSYSVNATLREMGLGQITDEQCKAFVGNGARRLLGKSIQAAGDPKGERIEEAMEIYGRIFKTYCTYHVAPYDGIVEMLKRLKQDGVQLAVLSNKPHLQTKSVIETYFEADTFSCVQGQKDSIPRKPDPAAVFMIMDELQVSKEECVYIGDSEVDMRTGNAAGVHTIGVTWGFRSEQVLRESNATYIVENASQINQIVKGEK